jgi:dTDP-4-amino-4,6-dideoxygalactose transaminase
MAFQADHTKLIRLSKSCLGYVEKQAVMEVLDREYLGMGFEVRRFEEALTAFFGRPAVCVVNGTAAVHLSVQACGLGSGDEVLVQSLTYVASFQGISATGARPVACEIDPRTGTLDIRDAERRLTSRTRAVMPVHYTGGVGDLDGIYRFAEARGLRVIEDAPHAFGTVHKGQKVGSFGDVACFSFDGIKNITSGEGGCVVSSDANILQSVRDARLLGVEKDTEQRYAGQRSWDFDVTRQGWRYHMSNIMAAIGLAQLGRFPEMAAKRRWLAHRYDERLRGCIRLSLFQNDYAQVVPHIYVVRVRGLRNRQGLRDRLMDEGIETGIHYKPNHWLTYYRDLETRPLPVTDEIFPELLTLPLHPDVTEADVEYICDKLIAAVE